MVFFCGGLLEIPVYDFEALEDQMTYPIRRYPERQFRQIIINLRIPTHKARYKKIIS